LLCGQDVLEALEENGNLGDLVLLPRVMLDNAGERFLDDTTVEEFKEHVPVRAEFVRNAQETIEAIRTIAKRDAGNHSMDQFAQEHRSRETSSMTLS
jgi:NifB/MoaA-like Fe-S oxidoreductase